MTRDEFSEATRSAVGDRVRAAVKAVLEQVIEEEMTEHLGARHRERTGSRTGERNGSYQRSLITPVGKIEQLRVPRDRDGTFTTQVFEEYHRATGEVEDALLEMWLQGISQRKIAQVTEKLGAVRIGKDAVSRIAQRLEDELASFRQRQLQHAYPYLFLDATYLKVNWGSHVGDLALLVAVGINGQGFREVLAVESAAGERKEAYRNLLKGLLERGLHGVQLVISDDHESIKSAVGTELPSARWQRCIAHFERNVLAHVPTTDMAEVAADLKGIFSVHRRESADALVEAFTDRYQKRFTKAVSVLRAGIADALSFLAFPSGHQRLLRTTNGLERLFGEVKRRTRVVGVFPSEKSAANLCCAVMLRATEEWALRRYLDMEPLSAMNRADDENEKDGRGN
jgi:Transposase and inactivated derivatives